MGELLTLFMAICFFVVGWNGVRRSESIQHWIVQLQKSNVLVAEMNPLRNWVEKKSFLIALRILGGLCLVNFIMLLSAFLVLSGSITGRDF